MLVAVLRDLDAWVAEANLEALSEGLPRYRACTIRILGQTALWEARVPLTLQVTQDVDVQADYEYAVQQRFEVLLAENGKFLDPVGDEIWMPKETTYQLLFDGRWVRGLLAESDFVFLSKAKMAPEKNRSLLVEMLARGPSDRFLALAEKYRIDLEAFV